MRLLHIPLLLILFGIQTVQALMMHQQMFVQNVLQIFSNMNDPQSAPVGAWWQWPWEKEDNSFERFWNDLPQVYDKALAFARHERDEFVKHNPEVVEKFRQLEQGGRDLVYAASQFDFSHFDDGEDTLTKKWEMAVEAVFEKLKEEFPAPDKAPSHEERKEVVGRALLLLEDEFVSVIGPHLGMDEKDIREKFGKVRVAVETVVVLIGDLIEQHPMIAGMVFFTVAAMILPEIPILRPILGFTAEGPGKGSIIAWVQRNFYGGYIPKGSLFSLLQKANAGTLKWISNGWKWVATGGLGGVIGGVVGSISLCTNGNRRRSSRV